MLKALISKVFKRKNDPLASRIKYQLVLDDKTSLTFSNKAMPELFARLGKGFCIPIKGEDK